MRKGFTLVELSIVLVIIGLLIGGILVAQSMLSSSKITAVVSQIQQFDAGVENFKTKYNALPGDAVLFGGNGDGLITLYPSWPGYINTYGEEMGNFWNNMMPDQYATAAIGTVANPKDPGKNVPLSSIGSPGSYFIASSHGGAPDNCQAVRSPAVNYYSILNNKTMNSNGRILNTTGGAVKPVDLLALDKKIDDGSGIGGFVISGEVGPDWCSPGTGGIIETAPAACSDGTGIYNVSNSGYDCTPLIRIGSYAGDSS